MCHQNIGSALRVGKFFCKEPAPSRNQIECQPAISSSWCMHGQHIAQALLHVDLLGLSRASLAPPPT